MGTLLLRYMMRQFQRLGTGSGDIHVEQARFKRPTVNIVERLRNIRSWHFCDMQGTRTKFALTAEADIRTLVRVEPVYGFTAQPGSTSANGDWIALLR
jgi:hypothetical protein